MSSEILKYCLVALLNQDADHQAQEMNALLEDRLESTKLATCLRNQNKLMQTRIGGGVGQAVRDKKALLGSDSVADNGMGTLMQTRVAGGVTQAPRDEK